MRIASLYGLSNTTLAGSLGCRRARATRAINGTTYRDVPHPVRAPSREGRPVSFLSYAAAVRQLASAADGEVEVEVKERPRKPARARDILVASPSAEFACPARG